MLSSRVWIGHWLKNGQYIKFLQPFLIVSTLCVLCRISNKAQGNLKPKPKYSKNC